MRRVLVIDPDDSRRRRLCAELADCEIIEAAETKDLHDALTAGLSAIVAAAESFDESTELTAIANTVPVVLVAAEPSIRHAVAAMRAGASDYLAHPLESGALAAALRHIAERAPAADRSAEFSPLIGHCPAMRELFDRIRAVAATNSTVLIQGESGTGKELVAHALHANSGRRHARMISLNCSVVPPPLLSRELFGSANVGASADSAIRRSLVAAADGGTLFLDAIGDLPPDAQEHLLAFLRQGGNGGGRFDVRLLAATHHDLKQLADNGHFRHDLFLLLNAVALRVPPLRERGEDVLAIANDILERTAVKLNKRGLSFAANAACAMRRYPWPGNVRELENAVERAAILCQGATIDASELAIDVSRRPPPAPALDTSQDTPAAAIDGEIEDSGALERFFLRFVLENQDQLTETELAERLGISRKSLWERRQRLDIPRRRTRKRGPRHGDA